MEAERVCAAKASESLLRISEVMQRVGLRKSALYRLIQEQKFPRPIKAFPGARASLFLASEIDKWIAERIRSAREKQ